MAHHRGPSHNADEEPAFLEPVENEQCPVCHQEFADGICPIASGECPYLKGEDDEEEDAEPDFEDVEHLGEVLKEDKEADRITEEEDLPPRRVGKGGRRRA